MIKLIQLADGRYKLTFEYTDEGVKMVNTWYFEAVDVSDAPEEKVIFSFWCDQK